ncbi:DUF6415 family natural product biosynthesis protein [Streptomyces sp. NPDC001678]|uniref:DUF6415 family natural product biosynthesis protein n=1 Tax=Streptomyces sp. NPDC001678 TaxID=3364599 RepID=UPI0036BCF808
MCAATGRAPSRARAGADCGASSGQPTCCRAASRPRASGCWEPDVLGERLIAYIRVTAAAVEAAVSGRPVGDPIRKDALAVVMDARAQLGLQAGDGYMSAIVRTGSLGRRAEALLEQ